jgi:hypothetical protein
MRKLQEKKRKSLITIHYLNFRKKEYPKILKGLPSSKSLQKKNFKTKLIKK